MRFYDVLSSKLTSALLGGACWVMLLGNQQVSAQGRVLVQQDFAEPFQGIDLSLTQPWGNSPTIESAFEVVDKTDRNGVFRKAFTMTPRAITHFDWHTPQSLRMLNSFDYIFPRPVNRAFDTLTVSWEVLWDTTSNGGEAGRINIILLHDYPQNGVQPFASDSLQIPNAFGRPAYSIRLLNRHPALGNSYNGFVAYGGGNDLQGVFYQFPTNDPQFWTPGAAPGPSVLGLGQYPIGGASREQRVAVANRREWRTFTLKLTGNKLTLFFRRTSEDQTMDRQFMEVYYPQLVNGEEAAINELNSYYNTNISVLPHLYNDFQKIEGIRFYGYGVSPTYWANINALATDNEPNSSLISPLQQKIKLYPNPINSTFNNAFRCGEDLGESVLRDSFGKLVARFPATISGELFNLPVGLAKGLYFFQAEGKKAVPLIVH